MRIHSRIRSYRGASDSANKCILSNDIIPINNVQTIWVQVLLLLLPQLLLSESDRSEQSGEREEGCKGARSECVTMHSVGVTSAPDTN